MELIEALEKLSIQVGRNNQNHGNFIISDVGQTRANPSDTMHEAAAQKDEQLGRYSLEKQQQLNELNRAIETLFMQVSEIDVPALTSEDAKKSYEAKRDGYLRQHSGFDHTYDYNGHNDTIQAPENNDKSNHSQTLVDHLMKRDLIAMTETVKKIGKMLDLGRQIESIYKNCFLNQPTRQHAIADIYAYRQLCDDFIALCWTEAAVCDLPTLSIYNQYYMELMRHLMEIMSSSQSSTASRQSSNSSSNPFGLNSSQDESSFCQSASTENMSDGHVLMEEVAEAFECDQFEFDQQQLACINWTTNKLYIDGSNN